MCNYEVLLLLFLLLLLSLLRFARARVRSPNGPRSSAFSGNGAIMLPALRFPVKPGPNARAQIGTRPLAKPSRI